MLARLRGQMPLGREGKEQYQEALRLLDRANKLGFRTRAYHLHRAQFLEHLGEIEEARRERDRALSFPPEGALDHFLLGEEQYRRGDWAEATNSFNRALAVQPGHFWAQFFLAVCHLKAQQWEAGKAGLNACLTQQPDFVWAYLFRSFANEKLQAFADAEADFQTALQLNPNDDARYVLFLTRGILRFNQKELDRAAEDFQSATALKPDQYNAYLNLAHVYLARRNYEKAEEQVSMAVVRNPPSEVVAGYHLQRGVNLLAEGRFAAAAQASEAALTLCPVQPRPHEVMARALLALGRYEEAEASFGEYLRKGGEPIPLIFRGRGLARMKLGRYPEAAEDYTRGGWSIRPTARTFINTGVKRLFFTDAWKLAARDFSKALELDADATDAYVGRGLSKVMLGDHREAEADADSALRRNPRSPEMMHNLACIFAQASLRVAADEGETDRKKMADRYRRRALQAVQQTLRNSSPRPIALLLAGEDSPRCRIIADSRRCGIQTP